MNNFIYKNVKFALESGLIEKAAIFFFMFVTGSVLLTCIFTLYPATISDKHEQTTNTVFLLYIFINIVGNYVLAVTTDNSYKTGVVMHEPPKTWFYCKFCNQHSPPRSHHCSCCKSCIIKQDHHCFFLGKCVGLKNQRYFLPFLVHVALGSFHCVKFVVAYLSLFYLPFDFTFYGFFSYTMLGLTYNFFLTDISITFSICCLVLLLYCVVVIGIGCACFFFAQLYLAIRGQTPYEYSKGITKHSLGFAGNLRSIFGRFAPLYFLFPFPIKYEDKRERANLSFITCI